MKKTITLLFAMLACGFFVQAQYTNEEKKVEKDGTVWYQVVKEISGDYKYGALDAQRRAIIPVKYDSEITYEDIKDEITSMVTGHYFEVVLEKKDGTLNHGIILPSGYEVYQADSPGILRFNSLFNTIYFYKLDGFNHKTSSYTYTDIGVLSPSTGGKFKKIIHLEAPDYLSIFSKDHFTAYSESKNIEIIYDVLGDELYRGPYQGSHFDRPIAEITGEKCLRLYNQYKTSDPDRADEYLEIAVGLKYQPAIDEMAKSSYDLAIKLMESDPKNEVIVNLLLASAMYDYVPAMSALGTINSVSSHWDNALEWYEKASAKGDGFSSRQAAEIYRNGWGGHCNRAKAKELYQLAIKQGDNKAQAALNDMNKEANRVIKLKGNLPPKKTMEDLKNLEELQQLFSLADEGYLSAINLYCHRSLYFTYGSSPYYYEGRGVGVDENYYPGPASDCEAIQLLPLLKAAAAKDANCQFMLACLYSGAGCLGKSNPTDISYVNVKAAQKYAKQFKANPKRSEAYCFGLQKEIVDWMLNNIAKMK